MKWERVRLSQYVILFSKSYMTNCCSVHIVIVFLDYWINTIAPSLNAAQRNIFYVYISSRCEQVFACVFLYLMTFV